LLAILTEIVKDNNNEKSKEFSIQKTITFTGGGGETYDLTKKNLNDPRQFRKVRIPFFESNLKQEFGNVNENINQEN
jgi:hypothetical protein